jgi:hypothetical protein
VAKRSVSGRPGYPVATNWQLLERSAQRFYDTAVAVMTEIEAYSPSDSTILKTRAYNDRLMVRRPLGLTGTYRNRVELTLEISSLSERF